MIASQSSSTSNCIANSNQSSIYWIKPVQNCHILSFMNNLNLPNFRILFKVIHLANDKLHLQLIYLQQNWRVMDIEESEEQNNEELDFQPLTLKTDKKLVLSHEAESIASSIFNRRTKNTELNRVIDPNNSAQRFSLALKTKQFGNFQHFLTKNKHRDGRMEVLGVMRQLAQQKKLILNGRVTDKLEKSKMILRVLSKEEATNMVMIEDETGKEKMHVKNGTVWVGLIACMDVSWVDGCYRLDAVNDLSFKFENSAQKCLLREPNHAYRILFLKGSFSRNDSKENIGIKILTNQLRILKEKEKIKLDCIVIFGPLLHRKNTALTSGFSELTFEQETTELIKLIKDEISKINQQIQIVFVPSTEDITNIYPIPQPKYNRSLQVQAKNVHYTSNPGLINLEARQNYQINLINYDLLQYLDENRAGRAVNQVMQQNIETYFKQPFYLTNAQDEPFDETNLPGLYNDGKFGHIIVTSSHRDPPFAREVRDRVYVNIGSLGIDLPNSLDRHYMTLVSIYDGEGPVAPRVKVQSLTM